MQVDGEPVMMKPCRIEISLGNHSSAPSAKMLVRNKTATCKNDAFDSFQRRHIIELNHNRINPINLLQKLSDAVRDDEIETWAAKTIQHSFKQYKKKTLSQEVTET